MFEWLEDLEIIICEQYTLQRLKSSKSMLSGDFESTVNKLLRLLVFVRPEYAKPSTYKCLARNANLKKQPQSQ